MSKSQKIALLLETLICFYPALYFLVGGTFLAVGLAGHSNYGSVTFPALLFLFLGYLGLAGVIALLIKILSPSTKTLSPLAIKINIGIGMLVYSFFTFGPVYISITSGRVEPYVFIYLLTDFLPIICSIHLLWLGRGYVYKSSS